MVRKKKGGAKRGREVSGRVGKVGFVRDMLARPVKEADQIEFRQLLEEFRASKDPEYQFPSTLSNNDRAVIHGLCAKLGLRSKSKGKDPNRVLHITKSNNSIKESGTQMLPISEKALHLIHKHFQRHPASPQEEAVAMRAFEGSVGNNQGGRSPHPSGPGDVGTSGSESSVKQFKPKRKRVRGPSAANFSSDVVKSKFEALQNARKSARLQDIEKHRIDLPVAKHREEILQAINGHQVMMVSGETGSGKTTQIPQFILEDCWSRGEPCRVLCTQPRRLSAVTVADRVAQEMGETVGENVGYKIRLEAKGGLQSALMFCTNGVLLRMMTQGGDVSQELTHIIVDEIHERDSYSDFLLILLRDILPASPGLKVILMSATLHEELFQNYFDGCPVVRVEGRTFPVEDYYLEDILRLTGYEDEFLLKEGVSLPTKTQPYCSTEQRKVVEDALHQAFVNGTDEAFAKLTIAVGADGENEGPLLNLQHSVTGVTALSTAVARGRMNEIQTYLSKGADPLIPAKNGKTAVDFAGLFDYQEVAVMLQKHAEEEEQRQSDHIASMVLQHYHFNTIVEEVDMELMERLLMFICGEGPWRTDGSDQELRQGPNAILIFLPGWDEIVRLKLRLRRSAHFGTDRYLLLPLHSQIPPAEQKRAFERPPPGMRKLILATNIAETSVTIEDVTVVVNSGRLKHKSHDPYCGVSTLMSDWTAKANEQQRRGRAGRCQPGVAFHMYSTARGESFNEYVEPELKRTSLEEICLLVKMACGEHGESIASFLAKAPDPPVSEAVTSAINLLKDIGALDEEEKLTVLGSHLGALPVDPKLGKMLLYGILFKCLDPILTVACSMEYRDPWVLPLDSRDDAKVARIKFGNLFAGNSDHLSTVAAFRAYKQLHGAARKQFCEDNFLSPATMAMIEGMGEQIRGLLADLGLVERQSDPGNLSNTHSEDISVVRCALACGLYPMVGCLKNMKIVTKKGEKVYIHRGSVNTKDMSRKAGSIMDRWAECSMFAFDEITRGDGGLYVRNTTVIKPHPFPLIAGNLSILEDEGEEDRQNTHKLMCLDGWLMFLVNGSCVKELCILRSRIAEAFSFKVSQPRLKFPQNLEHALRTVVDFFKLDARPPASESAMKELPALSFPKAVPSNSQSHSRHNHRSESHQQRFLGSNPYHNGTQQHIPSNSQRAIGVHHHSGGRHHTHGRSQGDRYGPRRLKNGHVSRGRSQSTLSGAGEDRKRHGDHRGPDMLLSEQSNSGANLGVLVVSREVLDKRGPRHENRHKGRDRRGRGGGGRGGGKGNRTQ